MAGAASAAPSILVYGDSLSSAYGIAQQRGWVALLEARLAREQTDYNVVNASISGETTQGGLARLPKVLAQVKPAIVILQLGANDGLRGLPIAQMKRNLEAMITQSQRAGAKLLLVGMKLPPNWGPEYTEAFENAYPALAEAHGTALLKFLFDGLADGPVHFQPDRLHPNEAAQPVILESVWAKLAPLL
ncbi:MAG TPA: arylesterase [Burkholderiales bacterium]|nr:arylesterase [Burkholderiales bacterium]